jgi:hypothetical protein
MNAGTQARKDTNRHVGIGTLRLLESPCLACASRVSLVCSYYWYENWCSSQVRSPSPTIPHTICHHAIMASFMPLFLCPLPSTHRPQPRMHPRGWHSISPPRYLRPPCPRKSPYWGTMQERKGNLTNDSCRGTCEPKGRKVSSFSHYNTYILVQVLDIQEEEPRTSSNIPRTSQSFAPLLPIG